MLFSIGEWFAGNLPLNGPSGPRQAWNDTSSTPIQLHDLSTTLAQVTSAPVEYRSTTSTTTRSPQPHSVPSAAAFDWSRAPITRARVFAERLTDVRPLCLVGSRADDENCLLDLPADVHLDVSATRVLLAGCEASLPGVLRSRLAAEGRDTRSLERTFAKRRTAESRGQYSVDALERRLNKRLHQILPGMHRLLHRTNAYIEIPQLTFLRVITSEPEARRHGIRVPFTDRTLQIPSGEARVHDAMLGAYLRLPLNGTTHTLAVSLASPQTIEAIRQNPQAHATAQRALMFGDIPAHFQTTNLRMRVVPHDENIARTLAKHLHDGHRRYAEFAYGATREALAPMSHANVRQRACPPTSFLHAPPTTSESPSTRQSDSSTAPVIPVIPVVAAPSAPVTRAPLPPAARSRRPSQRVGPSLAELARAIAELEELDRIYRAQGRPRYG